MCNACERPSTVWGVDPAGVAIAKRVEQLLARSLAHRPPGMEDIDGYVTVLATIPAAIPDLMGIGLAIYIGGDPELMLATSRSLPPRPQELAVAVFLGPPEKAPSIEGFLLALDPADVDVAASVVAALVEAALLGPSGTDWLPWPAGTPVESVRHVISGFVAQGTLYQVFGVGRATAWGVGRGRGETGAGAAVRRSLGKPGVPVARGADAPPAEGMVIVRIGSSIEPMGVRWAIAGALPRTAEWRVAVFPADGLQDDEVEVVVLGRDSGMDR